MSNYAGIRDVADPVSGLIKIGLVKQAAIRGLIVKNGPADLEQRELELCKQVVAGPIPATWVQMVLIELDIAGISLVSPTDSQIDTVITTGVTAAGVASVWSFLIATRG